MSKKQKQAISDRTNIPLKSRMTSNLPQSKKSHNNTPVVVAIPKKKIGNAPKRPAIQSSKEYLKILDELLWRTPSPMDTPKATETTAINYVDMINDLNAVCFMSIAPTLNAKNTCLYNETQMEELQLRIHDMKSKINVLHEKHQTQLDLQRAMLSYLKLTKNEKQETQETILDLYQTNETIMLIMKEMLVFTQRIQQLEMQYMEQMTSHYVTVADEQTRKIKQQELLIQDVYVALRDLMVMCPDRLTKDTSHTSTSSSSSYGSSISFSSFSTVKSAISTDGTRKASPYENELKDIVLGLTKQLQEKKACESLLHKKSASLVMELDLSKTKEELKQLRQEMKKIKETVFMDICKETEIKQTSEIKPSICSYIQRLHETFITRESGYILQSASLELQLQKVTKEHEYLTRNLIDFKLERQKYQQEIKKLKLEKYHYLTELNDYKVIRLNESKLRKEFRELMKNVKESHRKDMLVELKKQQELEQAIKDIKEDQEIKNWEKLDKHVQTNYPLI